jgi:CrcB protein
VARTLLLLGTGFLGSFSTFSTLAAELHLTLRKGDTGETLLLGFGSVLAGGVALAAGLWIAA